MITFITIIFFILYAAIAFFAGIKTVEADTNQFFFIILPSVAAVAFLFNVIFFKFLLPLIYIPTVTINIAWIFPFLAGTLYARYIKKTN